MPSRVLRHRVEDLRLGSGGAWVVSTHAVRGFASALVCSFDSAGALPGGKSVGLVAEFVPHDGVEVFDIDSGGVEDGAGESGAGAAVVALSTGDHVGLAHALALGAQRFEEIGREFSCEEARAEVGLGGFLGVAVGGIALLPRAKSPVDWQPMVWTRAGR